MQVLYFLLLISLLLNIVLCSKVISINKKISESIEVLDDIKKAMEIGRYYQKTMIIFLK